MLKLSSKIKIGNYTYTAIVRTTIESSWDLFTDTATIEFPTSFAQKSKNVLNQIKVGDSVSIELGYGSNTSVIFIGFVTKITPQNPVIIKCEDYMWKLKQMTIDSYAKNNVTIGELLTDLALPLPFETKDKNANLGKLRISQATVVEVLETLKDTYGLVSYIRDGETLVVGNINRPIQTETTLYFNGQKGTIIEDSLSYETSDSLKLYVKGVSHKSDNTKIERFAYYKGTEIVIGKKENGEGEQRVFNYQNLSESDLDNKLREILPQITYTGYRGSLTTFLRPKIRHGDNVILNDLKYPERNGKYLVKSVTTEFGNDGGRQIVTLDIIVN